MLEQLPRTERANIAPSSRGLRRQCEPRGLWRVPVLRRPQKASICLSSRHRGKGRGAFFWKNEGIYYGHSHCPLLDSSPLSSTITQRKEQLPRTVVIIPRCGASPPPLRGPLWALRGDPYYRYTFFCPRGTPRVVHSPGDPPRVFHFPMGTPYWLQCVGYVGALVRWFPCVLARWYAGALACWRAMLAFEHSQVYIYTYLLM